MIEEPIKQYVGTALDGTRKRAQKANRRIIRHEVAVDPHPQYAKISRAKLRFVT